MAKKLGRNPIIVVEKFSELPLIVEIAQRVGVRPIIGMRAKLATRGAGQAGKGARATAPSSA